MKKTAIFLILATFIISCNEDTENTSTATQVSTKINFNIQLPDSVREAILEGLMIFENTVVPPNACSYGQLGNVNIIKGNSREANGGVGVAEGYAVPGIIYINPETKMSRMMWRNFAKHEAFHLIKPKKYLPLNKTYKIRSGEELVGVWGLSLVFMNEDRKIVYGLFTEEAGAEAIACVTKGGYAINSDYYYDLGMFLNKIIKEGWITRCELIEWQRTNGMKFFCSAILNIPLNDIEQNPELMIRVSEIFYSIAVGEDQNLILSDLRRQRSLEK